MLVAAWTTRRMFPARRKQCLCGCLNTALVPGKQYWFKHTTRRTSGEIQSIRYAIDVNTLHRARASCLKLNEIGRCRVSLHDPVMFDSYRRNRQTGSFIVVDRITHETVAAGMFLDQTTDAHGEEHWEGEPASKRLQPAVSHIPVEDRATAIRPAACYCTVDGTERRRQVDDRVGARAATVRAKSNRSRTRRPEHANWNQPGPWLLGGRAVREPSSAPPRLRRCLTIPVSFVSQHLWRLTERSQKARELIGRDRMLHVHLSAPIDVCRERHDGAIRRRCQRRDYRFSRCYLRVRRTNRRSVILKTEHVTASECVERDCGQLA